MTGPGREGLVYRLTETRDLTLEQWIGGRVKALRLERGWNQRELALQASLGAGYHESWISRIEHGRYNLTVQTLQRLAAAFGMQPRDLLP